ncbi:hypothetical protein KM043_010105 [Ampulex compressa]|nr:hypothetical protein KM043_010105 [Ampulex compressa]
MEVHKSILMQKQVRDNSEDLQSEFLDMRNWEEQMKRKDEELRRERSGEIVLPPVRSKKNNVVKNKNKQIESIDAKRIKAYDYTAWEKYDVEKACEELEREPECKDATKEEDPQNAYELAQQLKIAGNRSVKNQKWDEGIKCYNECIKLFPGDATFYANRALCELKKDNLHSAEADCTTAIQLNETYVKAYYRRATIRMNLKQYKEAKQDLEKILKLEPSNKEAKSLLTQVNKKIENSKPIIISGEELSNDVSIEKKIGDKMFSKSTKEIQIIENKEKNDVQNERETSVKIEADEEKKDPIKNTGEREKRRDPRIPDWLPEKDNVTIVEPVIIPPHLRSKKPLVQIPIQEVQFDFMKHIENVEEKVEADNEHVESSQTTNIQVPKESIEQISASSKDIAQIPPVPKTAVQFIMDWRRNKSCEFRYKYLKQLPVGSLPKIFQDSMESDVFSDIVTILKTEFIKQKVEVSSFLQDLSQVKRFRALILFLSNSDKEGLNVLFEYCKTTENKSDEEVTNLRKIYEL